MAVQKSRRSRSTRGMRRMHDKLSGPTLSTDAETGEIHRRHHLTPNGFYRGRQVVLPKQRKERKEAESAAGAA